MVQGTAASDPLPVAVIGAGPVGLAAAAALVDQRMGMMVLECGEHAASHVAEWAHVRLFTPWSMNVDPVAARLLEASGWDPPEPDARPTGGEWRTMYLDPLAELPQIAQALRTGTRVLSVTRRGLGKTGQAREREPFQLLIERRGRVEELHASAVIDASGTWATPNPMGASGVAALGEQAAASRLRYGVPDIVGAERLRYEGRRVAVVGAGHSAQQAIRDLVEISAEAPRTTATWIVRGGDPLSTPPDPAIDPIRARAQLQVETHRAIGSGRVHVASGFGVHKVTLHDNQVVLHDRHRDLGPFDEVVVATGFRPDLQMLGELQVDLDARFEATRPLAALIDPSQHSCRSVPVHGWSELRHPEPGLFVIGMKSYGRAPTFLASTGYAQARSVVAHLHDGSFRGVTRRPVDRDVGEAPLRDTNCCGGPSARDQSCAEQAASTSHCGG